jgi:diguanylate cyclase (GGDEF)-like protein
MLNLDPRSLNLMSGLMGVVMGFVLLGLRPNFPAAIRGLWAWGLAPLVCTASTLVYGLEGLLPTWLVSLLGNGLLFTGVSLFYFGSRQFYGLPTGWQRWLAPAALTLGAITWFATAQPDYRIRVLFFTLQMVALLLAHLVLLLRHGRGFAARFTAAVLALQAAVLIARALGSWWLDGADTARFAPTALHALYLSAYSFTLLLVAIGVLLMASERVRAEFEHLARHDGLTGALTRRALLDAGAQELRRWQRYGRPLALLLLDVDHFKQINDQHGHLVGDRVLVDAVAQMGSVLRRVDLLGRYGGEEFVALLPETDAAAALAAAERMRASLAALPAIEGRPACTASIGVACAAAGDTGLDALLARADAALYRAKAAGRDRVELAG